MEIESYRSGDPDRQSNYMLFVAQGATEKGNVLSACTNKPRKQSIVYWDSDTEFDPSEINDLWRSLRPLDPKIVGREELGKIYEHQDFDSL